MKLNRKWILALALVMSMAMATTGTLAYLTDRDSEANVFTMGNVDIDLNEEFDQGAELIPGVNIEKRPTITNTGKNDAWVWATIAIPSKLDSTDASKNIVHFNFSKDSVANGLWKWTDANGNYMVKVGEEIDGVNYNVYTVLYQTALKPGETTTEPVITKVYMDYHIDIDPNGDVYHVENGVVTGPYWNVNTDKSPVIYVSAYAIQTEGFDTVQEGYAAYNKQWGDLGTEWGEVDEEIDKPTNGDDPLKTYPAPAGAYEVSNADELNAAVAAGETEILLAEGDYYWTGDAFHNKTVNLYGESKDAVICMTAEGGEGCDYDFRGANITFNGLTISSKKTNGEWTSGWGYAESMIYNDCIIDNTYNLVAGDHTFNYCTLNDTGNSYNLWTYGGDNVTFNHCTFNCAGKSIYMDGNGADKTTLTVNNCVFNDEGGVENKAAIETGTTYGTTYELIVSKTEVNGYAINPDGISTGSTLWANKHSMGTDKLNVVIDGVDVY